MLTVENLVGKGYFPQESIPSLISKDLVRVLPIIVPQLDILCKATKTSKCEEFTIPKIKNARRIISIPNPLHQIRLSNTISVNWTDIQTHVNKSKISASKVIASHPEYGNRSLQKVDFHNSDRTLSLITTARYCLKFDIARFYSPIYTHSVPWALHTKGVSKARRNRLDIFGNAVDEDLRGTQDGQTNGIPIGPDTSRVVSEIIASSIDVLLQNEITDIKGSRYVDDYSLYFKNYSEVESAISLIQGALSDFHLEPNQSKFQIVELPESLNNKWAITLGSFTFRGSAEDQKTDLVNFFSLAFDFSKSEPNAFVLPYAVSRFQTIIIQPKAWYVLEQFLLHVYYIEPKTIKYVFNILLAYKDKGFAIDLERVKECLASSIEFNYRLRNFHEVAWACWLAKRMLIKLDDRTAGLISKISSSSVALAAMDLNAVGLIDGGLDTTHWDTIVKHENLYSENWLLVYESVKKGWINRRSNFFNRDPFFKILSDNNVSFYDDTMSLAARKINVNVKDEYLEFFTSQIQAQVPSVSN
jgi:hypothetical protein